MVYNYKYKLLIILNINIKIYNNMYITTHEISFVYY